MQTVVPFGDPKAQKHWSASLFVDTRKKSYFNRRFIGTSEDSVIQQKTEVEREAGDTISYDLSMQLRAKPTHGDGRLKGKEEALRFYSDEVYIDQMRHAVSAGGRMTRKRTAHDMRAIARDRLSDYWADYIDELMFVYLSGARGANEDFIEDQGFAGTARNPIQPPDDQHLLYGGAATSKATVSAADGMTTKVIEQAKTAARMMKARDRESTNLMPVSVEGEQHYVLLMNPHQEEDLRTSTSEGNWLDIQKAAAGALGKSSPIFRGTLGMLNKVVLHSHEKVIRFTDYGVGGDVPAARALFLARQAGVLAYGLPSARKDIRFSWEEEVDDYGNEPTVAAGTILGVKKTRFNARDFGVIAIDTHAARPAT